MKRAALILMLLLTLNLVWVTGKSPRPQNDVGPANFITTLTPPSLKISERGREEQLLSRAGYAETELLLAIDAESDSEHRSELLSRAAESIPDAELPEALGALAGLDIPAAAELRQLLVQRWAQSSPRAAAEWANRLPEGSTSTEAVSQISIAWANSDLQAAVAWVTALPESAAKVCAILNLAYEAARIDPLTAMNVAAAIPRSSERDTLLTHAISQWAEVDPVTATAWAEAVPEVELRQRLVAATSVALANQNGAAAAKLAVNVLRPGEDQDRAVVAIVQRWAENSPRTAADWVAQFPDTSVQALAVQNLVALWTAQDPIGPVNWLRGLPETSLRRAGWSAYGQAMQQQDRAILSGTSSTGPVSAPQKN